MLTLVQETQESIQRGDEQDREDTMSSLLGSNLFDIARSTKNGVQNSRLRPCCRRVAYSGQAIDWKWAFWIGS